MEGTALKAFYALVFVLFSFAAPAQSAETSVTAYLSDEADCFGETTHHSALLVEIIEQLLCATKLDETNIVIAEPTDEVPVGAIHASDENSTVKSSAREDKLEDRIEGAIAGPDDADEISLRAIHLTHENSTAKSSTKGDKLRIEDRIEAAAPSQNTASHPTIDNKANDGVIAGPNDADDISVGTTQPTDENSSAGRGKLTVDDTIEQGAAPTQIIAAAPTIEKLDEAIFDEADDLAITGRNDERDIRVGDEPQW
jgi:hypothetical protein